METKCGKRIIILYLQVLKPQTLDAFNTGFDTVNLHCATYQVVWNRAARCLQASPPQNRLVLSLLLGHAKEPTLAGKHNTELWPPPSRAIPCLELSPSFVKWF
jgi:hypothetical protein